MLKKILVIEDARRHNADAKREVEAAGLIQVGFGGWDLESAMRTLKNHGGEEGFGVLTDLYFPARNPGLEDGDVYMSKFGMEMQPLGLLVMAECRARGIPCVIVTAGHHHGTKYHEVFMGMIMLGWPRMVDSSNDQKEEAPIKNWAEGLRRLHELSDAADQPHADPSGR